MLLDIYINKLRNNKKQRASYCLIIHITKPHNRNRRNYKKRKEIQYLIPSQTGKSILSSIWFLHMLNKVIRNPLHLQHRFVHDQVPAAWYLIHSSHDGMVSKKYVTLMVSQQILCENSECIKIINYIRVLNNTRSRCLWESFT